MGVSGATEDGIAAGGLNGGDDGGGECSAIHVQDLGVKISGDRVDAGKLGNSLRDGADARVTVEWNSEGGLEGEVSLGVWRRWRSIQGQRNHELGRVQCLGCPSCGRSKDSSAQKEEDHGDSNMTFVNQSDQGEAN